MKKTITKTIEVEVNVCDVCKCESEEVYHNRLAIAWAKNGVGTFTDGYELCDTCWVGFQQARDGWLRQSAPSQGVFVDYVAEEEMQTTKTPKGWHMAVDPQEHKPGRIFVRGKSHVGGSL